MDTSLIIITIILDGLSITGMQLNASKRFKLSMVVWLIANTGWIVYDFVVGVEWQSILFITYSLQCIYGLCQKPEKKNIGVIFEDPNNLRWDDD